MILELSKQRRRQSSDPIKFGHSIWLSHKEELERFSAAFVPENLPTICLSRSSNDRKKVHSPIRRRSCSLLHEQPLHEICKQCYDAVKFEPSNEENKYFHLSLTQLLESSETCNLCRIILNSYSNRKYPCDEGCSNIFRVHVRNSY